MLTGVTNLMAKGFKAPSEGKAVVYFTRLTNWGLRTSFEYFHEDKYIGVFKGRNYIRYECDPGKQLLWTSSENKEFITTDLKLGGTYIVVVDPKNGIFKYRVGLNPITVEDGEKLNLAIELINEKEPILTSEKKIKRLNIKLKSFISEKLKMYETIWKKKYDIVHISSDMAIPEVLLK